MQLLSSKNPKKIQHLTYFSILYELCDEKTSALGSKEGCFSFKEAKHRITKISFFCHKKRGKVFCNTFVTTMN